MVDVLSAAGLHRSHATGWVQDARGGFRGWGKTGRFGG
jgi:hypothetical protein